MTNAQKVKAHAAGALMPVMVKVVQPNSNVSYDPVVESKVLKRIDYFDSQISNQEKEISKLLNL
ncbi:MAG: hypothetical protein IPG59_01825 [Candidatus Melainabacteria bacterium]|nr:MAG: hypothetical protein IPG59_01825 [Candidatus Melainabacteria bacterium]